MNSLLRNPKDRRVDDNMATDPGIPTAYYYHTLNTLNPSNYTMNGLDNDSETVHFSDIETNLIPITVQLTIQQR